MESTNKVGSSAKGHAMTAQARKSQPLPLILILVLAIGLPLAAMLILVFLIRQADAVSETAEEAKAAECRQEIEQLGQALIDFQRQFDAPAPPSRLKLSETGSYDTRERLDRDSAAYLRRLFPRCTLEGIDWNGNGRIDQPDAGGDVILEGDQCLVFFLGGIPGRKGFSANPRNPAADTAERQGPFFEFAPGRLGSNGNAASTQGFLSYRDVFATNFCAYFSASGRRNGYNPHDDSDCHTLGVWPYASGTKPPQYQWPDNFQILSAGKDGKFGPGTALPDGATWSPATARKVYPEGSAGADDLSNFHNDLLGRPGGR